MGRETGGVAEDESGSYGPLALYVGGEDLAQRCGCVADGDKGDDNDKGDEAEHDSD